LKTYWNLLAILFSLTFTGCSPVPVTSGNSPALRPTTSPYEGATQVPSSNSSENSIQSANTPDFSEMTLPPSDEDQFVGLAKQDLATRLNISKDQISLLKVTEINWQDITQGCTSTPGQKLNKGRLSGYRIWLEANRTNYAYHIG
jgi:hypothetical protein